MQKNGISQTAWIVPLCQLALRRTRKWGALVIEDAVPFYQAAVYYCRRRSTACRLVTLLPDALKLRLVERLYLKGAPQHYLLRRQAVAKQTVACIHEGITQLIVLSGGFDPSAMLLAERYPHVACLDIDTPSMQDHKMNVAAALYGALPDNFTPVAADIGQMAEAAAAEPAFSAERSTLVVAENLAAASEPVVRKLLADLRRLCRQPLFFLFTFRENPGRAQLDALLAAGGYSVIYALPYEALQEPWRTPREMEMLRRQGGEYLVYASAKPL